MHGGAGGGVGGPLPGEPKDPWEVRNFLENSNLYVVQSKNISQSWTYLGTQRES